MQILAPALLFGSVPLTLMFASLMVSTATIILGGIPAAIYERSIGAKDDSTEASLWIWLAGTALLTLPAIGNFFAVRPLIAVSRAQLLGREHRLCDGGASGSAAVDAAGPFSAAGGRHGAHAPDRVRDRVARLRLRLACDLLRDDRPVLSAPRRLPGRRNADAADGRDPDAEGPRGAHEELPQDRNVALLPKEQRPPEAYAQRACSTVLRETYLTFARWAASLAVVMGLLALLFSLAGK